MSPAKFFWNDSWLQAASDRAFRSAAYGVKTAIEAKKPARSIPVRGPFFGTQMAGAARGVRTGRGSSAVVKAGGLGPIFEKGASPHRIEASAISGKRRRGGRKKALAFEGRFAASVNHPGMRAKPFMGPAARTFGPLYRTALARSLPRPRV